MKAVHWFLSRASFRVFIHPHAYGTVVLPVGEILLDVEKGLDHLGRRNRFVEREAKGNTGQVLEPVEDDLHVVDVLHGDLQVLDVRRHERADLFDGRTGMNGREMIGYLERVNVRCLPKDLEQRLDGADVAAEIVVKVQL